MKKLSFICIVCLCATLQTNAQLRDTTLNMSTHKVDANALLQKSKKQKTAAWLLMGGGAGIAIAGLAIISHDASWNTSQAFSASFTTFFTLGYVTPTPVVYKHSAAGPILAIAGAGAILGSIALFNAAAKNKRKYKLMLNNETIFFNPQINLKEHLVVATLKINF